MVFFFLATSHKVKSNYIRCVCGWWICLGAAWKILTSDDPPPTIRRQPINQGPTPSSYDQGTQTSSHSHNTNTGSGATRAVTGLPAPGIVPNASHSNLRLEDPDASVHDRSWEDNGELGIVSEVSDVRQREEVPYVRMG